ncbi:MAG: type II toxin-antitoxin system VapC family toxin [Chloroflexi bacterium]|nr:type II toxin-antitoxin system VapC family toxin [Chloroflexota bacterium]
MIASVFVDASAWVATFSPDDANHVQATVLWGEVIERNWALLTTNWALYEALIVLKRRAGIDAALKLWDLDESRGGMVRVVRVALGLEEAAVQTFFQHKDKTWSVVDCASFHTIRERKCRLAFAYDAHFRQASGEFGFELLE